MDDRIVGRLGLRLCIHVFFRLFRFGNAFRLIRFVGKMLKFFFGGCFEGFTEPLDVY